MRSKSGVETTSYWNIFAVASKKLLDSWRKEAAEAGKDEKETQVRRQPSIGQQVQRTSGSRRSSLRRKNVGNVENVGVLFHAVELCPFEDVSVIDEALWNIAEDLPRSQKSRPN